MTKDILSTRRATENIKSRMRPLIISFDLELSQLSENPRSYSELKLRAFQNVLRSIRCAKNACVENYILVN